MRLSLRCRGAVTPEPAGNNCTYGGVSVQVGNGAPNYVCNVTPGANGSNGTNGTDGQSATVTAESPGTSATARRHLVPAILP